MEQHQFKVSLSVGTKLLVSVLVLLVTIILFLNIASIYLFREDKRVYTYQLQSSHALLAGREMVSFSLSKIEDLKYYLSLIDPKKPVSDQTEIQIRNALQNQKEILFVRIFKMDPQTGKSIEIGQYTQNILIKENSLRPEDYVIGEDWFQYLKSQLLQETFAFLNLSKPGSIPTLMILVADTSLDDTSEGIPVAAGLVSLASIASDLKEVNTTIATQDGWVLYDQDPSVMFSKGSVKDSPLFKAALQSKVENGALEFEENETRFLGSFLSPGLNLVALTKVDWQSAMKSAYVLIEKFIVMGTVAVGSAIIFAILFSKTLTAPLSRLYRATLEISQGNFGLKVEEKGSDEITALSRSFNFMSEKIQSLVQESIEKVKLENEFAIASTVQQTLIPPSQFETDWIEIHSHYQPADQCGGDWWGFFGVDDKVAIMIGDATGHGLPSALMTASARSCFSVMHKWAQEDPDFNFSPSAMLSFANRVIFDASGGKIMMTFFIGVIDRKKRTLTYSNAGQNPPWLFQKKGNDYTMKSLPLAGQRLGEVREYQGFEEKQIAIFPDDILFLYTDGLVEGSNAQEEMFGKKRARQIIQGSVYGGPSSVIASVTSEFESHMNGKTPDDDVTMAAIRMTSL